ncbi:MAG TPA: Ig-like domain-containing protein [Steroidobacteraceae bacterium]|nr:Ig-like domain-containing protein [Steroidobacteraceae bacterium]
MLALSAASLFGCGGGAQGRGSLVVESHAVSILEETRLLGQLSATGAATGAVSFTVTTAPLHGSLTLDAATGSFVYDPLEDFFGVDAFGVIASSGGISSEQATVSIHVQNVNDTPRLREIGTVLNSPEAQDVVLHSLVTDPDGDAVELTVELADSRVADAWIDEDTGALVLRALAVGETGGIVTASDGQSASSMEFRYDAREVVKRREYSIPDPTTSAMEIRNESASKVAFHLTYSGVPVFESVQDMLHFVRALPDEFPGESLPRKIWRFVRDFSYHNAPFSSRNWLYSPWVTINSLGWGFCAHVSAVFVEIARAAGYDARVWGLDGHVVAEVRVDGMWQMYDADLAVYYRGRSGRVAGVEELANDPDLIVNPIAPIFEGSSYDFPYSPTVAEIYASVDDNFVGDSIFLAQDPMPGSRFELPPGSRLVFPGRWTEPPTAYDGSEPRLITQYGQVALEIPPGWTGSLSLPLMLWEIQGSGTVAIDGTEFTVGSERLRDRIQNTDAPITSVLILANDGLRLVHFVNAMQFAMRSSEVVDVKGLDVWALETSVIGVPANEARGSVRMRKPLPTVIDY